MTQTEPTNRATADEAPPRVRVTGIKKRFGAIRAIRNADMTIRPGTVHALVGENGAGKSTLIKILAGAEAADAGTIELDGSEVNVTSTTGSMALGIATVYQEPQLFPELTVTETIFIGRELRRGLRVDWVKQRAEVDRLLDMIGLPRRVATLPVGQLPVAQQQQVSIAKALAHDARVLILDEPSAILTDSEIDVLFDVVRKLTSQGVSVIYISHRLDELFRIADEVTVMRDGRTIGTYPIGELSVRKIAELMVGGVIDERTREAVKPATDPVFTIEGLTGQGFSNVDLVVHPGEILGLFGLVGSGAAEIAASIWGKARIESGTMTLEGKTIHPRSPRQAQKLGIALLPADRKHQGMFSFQSIAFNISAAHIPLLTRLRLYFDRRRETAIAREMITKLSIKTPHERQPIGAMSGGNSQKTVLARQLVERPALLVLQEPTQGVDVGAKEEIHHLIAQIAEEGSAVLVVTSDLPEALRISDRVLVVRGGTTTRLFEQGATQVDVLAAASGDIGEPAAAEPVQEGASS